MSKNDSFVQFVESVDFSIDDLKKPMSPIGRSIETIKMSKNIDVVEDTQNNCGLHGSDSWCTGDCTHCNHYIPKNVYEEIPKDELAPTIEDDDFKIVVDGVRISKMKYLD